MRKKILVLTPRYPYPVVGGDRLRIYNLCKELGKTYDLTLLSLCDDHKEMIMPHPDDGVFGEIRRVRLPAWKSYLNSLRALPSGKPLQVAYYQSSQFKAALMELLPNHDGVLAHLIRVGDYIRYIDIPKVLEMTDAISLNYKRVGTLAKAGGIRNAVYSVEQTRMWGYEKKIVDDFDLSVMVSDVDRDYLFQQNNPLRERVLVCSNGVDMAGLPYKRNRQGRVIAFLGNMNSVQNLDAVKWFAWKVMPLLLNQGFTFKVVGRIPENQRVSLNKIPGVYATGGVESVAMALDDAIVGVCPVRLGAGVQNKILEYMALGLPVVSSSMGYEGLTAQRDEEILIKDKPEDIADCIINLAQSPVQREQMAARARRYIELNHSWERMLQPFIDRVSALV